MPGKNSIIAAGDTAGTASLVWLAQALAVLLAATAADGAQAAGFALREQSTSSLGSAFADSLAGAEDLSYLFYNPASITRLSGHQALGTIALIMPQVEFKDGSASTARGVAISGGNGGQDVAPDEAVPVFYALWDVQRSFDLEQNIKVGLGVNVPFALESDYADGWVGRYHALQSRLRTFNANPSVAWEVIDGLSLAAGLQVQYADARLTNAVDYGSIAQAAGPPLSRLAQPGQQDGKASIDGDDIGFGYNFGLLYEPWAGTRFGASFRSSIDHNLKGDAQFTYGDSIGQVIAARSGAFVDSKASARLTTPWTAGFGFQQRLDDAWAVMGSVERTGWSSFDELRIKFQNPNQPDSVTDESWNDTWFGALGVAWRPAEAWRLTGGVAWDQSPVPGKKRTPRIPAENRTWLAIGVGWMPWSNVSVDFGYAHLFSGDADIELTAAEKGNTFRGNLSGTVETAIDIVSLQARWRF